MDDQEQCQEYLKVGSNRIGVGRSFVKGTTEAILSVLGYIDVKVSDYKALRFRRHVD